MNPKNLLIKIIFILTSNSNIFQNEHSWPLVEAIEAIWNSDKIDCIQNGLNGLKYWLMLLILHYWLIWCIIWSFFVNNFFGLKDFDFRPLRLWGQNFEWLSEVHFWIDFESKIIFGIGSPNCNSVWTCRLTSLFWKSMGYPTTQSHLVLYYYY